MREFEILARRSSIMMSSTGRGGFYGSLHPAYQPFSIPTDGTSTHGSTMTGPPAIATASADAGKLDEILSLLHSQQQEITTLTSEVLVLDVRTSYLNYYFCVNPD